jgi:hypothetical protein
MYTDKEAIDVIRASNAKQLKFLAEMKDEIEYTVPNKVMNDNAIAIDWLLKYIDKHCCSSSNEKKSYSFLSAV